MVGIIKKENWSMTEAEQILSDLKDLINPQPQPEDLGGGVKYIGLNTQGLFTYTKTVNGKEQFYFVDPNVWELTKKIFNHAIQLNSKPFIISHRLKIQMNSLELDKNK